jgi:AcrR family transcriptional regulator
MFPTRRRRLGRTRLADQPASAVNGIRSRDSLKIQTWPSRSRLDLRRWRTGVRPARQRDDGGVLDVDATVVHGSEPPSARTPLGRDRILKTAVRFIDDNGMRGLTMRRLGAELGVEAMSLYRYVPGREALLDGVVETVIGEMYDDPAVVTVPRDGWQDFLQRLAHGVRRVALAHPAAFPLVASRPPEAPWLRPPPRVHQLPAGASAPRGRVVRRRHRTSGRPGLRPDRAGRPRRVPACQAAERRTVGGPLGHGVRGVAGEPARPAGAAAAGVGTVNPADY